MNDSGEVRWRPSGSIANAMRLVILHAIYGVKIIALHRDSVMRRIPIAPSGVPDFAARTCRSSAKGLYEGVVNTEWLPDGRKMQLLE
jgi:hypothetical protein